MEGVVDRLLVAFPRNLELRDKNNRKRSLQTSSMIRFEESVMVSLEPGSFGLKRDTFNAEKEP